MTKKIHASLLLCIESCVLNKNLRLYVSTPKKIHKVDVQNIVQGE